jgi:hypothetical protein
MKSNFHVLLESSNFIVGIILSRNETFLCMIVSQLRKERIFTMPTVCKYVFKNLISLISWKFTDIHLNLYFLSQMNLKCLNMSIQSYMTQEPAPSQTRSLKLFL